MSKEKTISNSGSWKLNWTYAHVALSRCNVNFSGNKTTVWVLGWHRASQDTFLHNSSLIKRDALHLSVPLTFFFSYSIFLRTDFLRELLMFRAFYPDILDNDVTTQVHLLLFCWKLTKAKDLMDNGHIFQQRLMYMWEEWLSDLHIKPNYVRHKVWA